MFVWGMCINCRWPSRIHDLVRFYAVITQRKWFPVNRRRSRECPTRTRLLVGANSSNGLPWMWRNGHEISISRSHLSPWATWRKVINSPVKCWCNRAPHQLERRPVERFSWSDEVCNWLMFIYFVQVFPERPLEHGEVWSLNIFRQM